MKSIFEVKTKDGERVFLAANLTVSIIRMKKEYNAQIEATGLKYDSFGFAYIRGILQEPIFTLAELRKYLKNKVQ